MVFEDLDARGQLRGRVAGIDGVVEFFLQGELDMANSAELVRRLALLDAMAPREVVIDLADLRFIDLAGMRALETACDLLGRKGARLVVRNPRAPVRRLFALATSLEIPMA